MQKNTMKIAVPFNWQEDLLPFFCERNIYHVYGKISGDFIGISMPSFGQERGVLRSDAAARIKTLHQAGIALTYVIDGACLDNAEWTSAGQRKIRELLDRLVSWGVGGVSVSMPYFLELIKKNYPALSVEISAAADVDSVERAKRWENLGADIITLASYKLNRDFSLLKTIRDHVRCDLQLVANHCCLNGCVDHSFHVNALAHETLPGHDRKNGVNAYCLGVCMARRLNHKFEILASPWIRPEDMHYYEDIGINRLQLLGMNLNGEDVRRIIAAYDKRSYEGNFLDLLPDFVLFQGVGAEQDIVMRNSDLTGFLTYFLQEECRRLCDECVYCKEAADKIVAVNFERAQERLRVGEEGTERRV